ncbi:hypothetical protein CK203_050846 [Vitis vinifera]|uniref:Uncharacterized protein n=1 Tax=Vitis vinifera TaxID=29760 RepID=A0A438HBW1_VITVI|nr:hypothetical protein CK203_050846 [Vitis vinifera]
MERESEGDEGDAREENRRRRKEGSFGVESKTFEIGVRGEEGQNSSRYCGEQGRGLILGPSGADECRSLPGQSEPVHQGRGNWKMGKGDGKKMGELIPWCGM